MLRAFNTAAAFHGLSTQMKHVFGIYAKPKPHRLFKIVYVRTVTITDIHTNTINFKFNSY